MVSNDPASGPATAGAGTTPPATTSRRRVLVAIDPARVRTEPLELAARLAQELGLELSALLVQEQAFVNVAALPFTREFRLSSGQWSEFEPHEVERGFRDMRRRAERLLGDVSRRHGVRFSIHVESGAFPHRALEVAAPTDVLLVDRAPPGYHATGGYRRVATLYDGSEGAGRALATAAGLARGTRHPLRVVIAADSAERFAELRREVRERIADAPAPALEFAWLGSADAGDLAKLHEAVRDGEATLLVLAGDAPAAHEATPTVDQDRTGGAPAEPGARVEEASAASTSTIRVAARCADVTAISRRIRCSVLLMR
ncbi:MAG: hypothetical protein R3E48_11100 [Burkholderiaceae bacterium]